MAKIHYTEGARFHHLVYIHDVPYPLKQRKALFRCDCGNETIAYLGNVKKGSTTSCGCAGMVKRDGDSISYFTT